jgi:hypothetical protein
LLGFAYQLTAQLHCFPSREEAFCVDATEAPASDAATEMGPLVSLEQQNRVCGYLESGSSEGAKALAGGHKSSDKGYFVEPTVQVNTREDMKVVQEEIFGPVVVAMPFSDPAELVPSANDNVYGLAAGIWTRDISKPTAWPTKSLPEPSGSTAATSSTLPCPSVATFAARANSIILGIHQVLGGNQFCFFLLLPTLARTT